MNRRHDLDWVRVCAFGLLVFYHVGMYYVSWDWHVKSPYASELAQPFMLLSAPWRLALLFLISGAATSFLLGKKAKGFLGKRSWRLLVPLIFGMLVIVPPQSYYEVVEKLPGGYFDGYFAFWSRYLHGDPSFCRDSDCLRLPTWNHLWYLVYLWVYTVALWILLRIAPKPVRNLGAGLVRNLDGVGILIWPALMLGFVRMAMLGTFGSTHALVDDWYNHAQYFSVFLLGFLIANTGSVWQAMQRHRWPALALAILGWILLNIYYSTYSNIEPPEILRQLQRVLWGIMEWSAIVAVLGFAVHFDPADSPALRYLSQAVFPVYILHQTLIVVFAHNLKPFGLHPAVEAPLLIAGTFAACFAGYEIVRRIFWMRPLFGLKRLSTKNSDKSAQLAST